MNTNLWGKEVLREDDARPLIFSKGLTTLNVMLNLIYSFTVSGIKRRGVRLHFEANYDILIGPNRTTHIWKFLCYIKREISNYEGKKHITTLETPVTQTRRCFKIVMLVGDTNKTQSQLNLTFLTLLKL
jgi:hypothetical protein